MPQTYRQLLEKLSKLTNEQLDLSVIVHDPAENEFYPAELRIIDQSDVLDADHPVVYMNS